MLEAIYNLLKEMLGAHPTSSRTSGTTSASYVTALTWDCSKLREKNIHLLNAGAINSLYYKLLARYSMSQTSEDTLVAETSLAAAADASFAYNNQYVQLILQVKNNAGATDYEVNYSGQGA